MSRYRWLFLISAAFNGLVALALVVPGSPLWPLIGMAAQAQLLFVHLFAALVATFGLAYFWIALSPLPQPTLIRTAIVGKLLVVAVALAHCLHGSAPWLLMLPASGDVIFAVLFIRVLQQDNG